MVRFACTAQVVGSGARLTFEFRQLAEVPGLDSSRRQQSVFGRMPLDFSEKLLARCPSLADLVSDCINRLELDNANPAGHGEQ
jgi:hypothetical protein